MKYMNVLNMFQSETKLLQPRRSYIVYISCSKLSQVCVILHSILYITEHTTPSRLMSGNYTINIYRINHSTQRIVDANVNYYLCYIAHGYHNIDVSPVDKGNMMTSSEKYFLSIAINLDSAS